jgi:ribosomal protein S18 acetylase RimI-like enzyme
MTYTIRTASAPEDFNAMARLIGEYVTWLRARYQADQWFITEVLDKQSLSSELNQLSSMYGPPNGKALVAVDGTEIVGCGAYRALGDGTCEMKRVFVPSYHQGRGIGRALCNELIQSARAQGYTAMKLDTGKVMTEALSLYRALGFEACEPYYDYPERLLPYFVFMTLPLER